MPIYHVDYRAHETRKHKDPPVWTFAAADDTAADAIVAVYETYFLGVPIRLTKRIQDHNLGENHPAGTTFGMKVYVKSDNLSTIRYQLRNIKEACRAEDVRALWLGEDSPAGGTTPVVGLGAPPAMPFGAHDPITKVTGGVYEIR